MHLQAVKTNKITPRSHTVSAFCDEFVPKLAEGTIVVVASKIVSLCEDNIVPSHNTTKHALAEHEADQFLPPEDNKFHYMITIKNHTLISSAGIDRSNGGGYFILWPKDPQASANSIRSHLAQTRGVKRVGVIISDTMSKPLRRGATGICLAHSGFAALNDYRGRKDVFNQTMRSTVINIAESLAAAAVLVMGEGSEQQPIVLVEDVPFVEFQPRNPTKEELRELSIQPENDIFASLLLSAPWQKKKKRT